MSCDAVSKLGYRSGWPYADDWSVCLLNRRYLVNVLPRAVTCSLAVWYESMFQISIDGRQGELLSWSLWDRHLVLIL